MPYNTLIVNLFCGPHGGKTTLAKKLAGELGTRGIICDCPEEYARELILSNRMDDLSCQPYVFGEQLRRIERAFGKVQVIVTDSPLLLSVFYTGTKYGAGLRSFAHTMFTQYSGNNLNLFIQRSAQMGYSKVGRVHDLKEAILLDNEIYRYLVQNEIRFTLTTSDKFETILANIVYEIGIRA
jgi:nicotinamide riboside kinase